MNPQLENGYVRIANELLEAILRAGFSKRELLIVFAVIRKTYGFGKKADEISLTQLQGLTGIFPTHLSKSVTELVEARVLLKQSGDHANSLSINKRYAEWDLLPKQSPMTETVSDQNGNSTMTETVQNLLPKQSIQKTLQKTTPKDNGFACFWKAYPKKKSKGQAEKTWAKLNPSEQLLADILAGIERAKTSADWRKDNGKWIQHPSTWLNAKGWEDEHAEYDHVHILQPGEID